MCVSLAAGNHGVDWLSSLERHAAQLFRLECMAPGHNVSSLETDTFSQAGKISGSFLFLCVFPWTPRKHRSLPGQLALNIGFMYPVGHTHSDLRVRVDEEKDCVRREIKKGELLEYKYIN